jgi:hypothetical protein
MRTKKILLFVILAVFSIFVSSCGSAGLFSDTNLTDVRLGEGNYTIVARDVTGESQAAYILGGTMSTGMTTSIYALFKVNGTSRLYSDALNSLWKNFEKTNGSIIGKKYALVNVRYDANALNLFVYTSVKITIRADVVEFITPGQ